MTAFMGAFSGLHTTVDQVWIAGDTVIVRWINIGVQETDYMGVPPSRETVTWTGISVFRLECGKAVEAWTEADHFGRIQQQGVVPVTAPEATPEA
jgi:predicted ester cyclase